MLEEGEQDSISQEPGTSVFAEQSAEVEAEVCAGTEVGTMRESDEACGEAAEVRPRPKSQDEEQAPMIDVHAPHEGIHSWRQYMLHMSTIVLGLLIAISLEQSVEYFHRLYERHHLRNDLRAEAEDHIRRLHVEEEINAADIAWYRGVLRAGREARVTDGWVTFTLPLRPPHSGHITVPANGVWPAAKASGTAAVLPAEEIALWDYIDSGTAVTTKSFDGREEALKVTYGFAERKGVSTVAGATLHLSVEDRDELMRAFSRLLEETYQLERDDAYGEGAIQGVLDGEKTVGELDRDASRAINSMPK